MATASRAAPAITDDKHVDQQNSRSWSSDPETESREITRNLSAARRQYAASSREAAQHILMSNLAKAKQSAVSRQQRHCPSSSFSSLSTAGRQALPVHLHNIVLGASKTVLAVEMPLVEPLPPYKAWDYLVSNELAQGVGRQMYYTDEIGETIPLSDSDEEAASDTESLDGVSRQADMFLLNEALSQYGIRSDVVRIAAGMMKVKKASVQARMHALAGYGAAATPACSDNQKLDVMIANFTNAFCRRCRVFNCFSHKGPHTKPQQRRPLPPAAPDTPPCGPHCFKASTSISTLNAASQATSAAVTNSRQEGGQAAAQSAAGLQNQHVSQPAMQAADEAEVQEDEEEEEKLLPMRAAPRPAGPSGAVGQQPSDRAATGAFSCYSPSERCEAMEGASREAISPGFNADASNAIAGAVKSDTASVNTRKRKREQSLLHEGAVTAASPASATASAAAGAAASSHAAHGPPAFSSGGDQGTKKPSPMQSLGFRRYAHTHSPGDSPALISPASSSLPIILSDSEDEKPSPNPNPKPTAYPQIPASNDPTPSPRQTPTPTPTPRTRKPSGFSSKGPSAAVGFLQESADSPFVIILSDSDDSNSPREERTGEALAGLVMSTANPNSQHQMTRQSTAKDSRGSEGTGCPSVSPSLPQALPLEMKGSTAPSPSSLTTNQSPEENPLPGSKQTPLSGSKICSLTLAHTSSSVAADAAKLQESFRQAARSSALLPVPRRPKSACNSLPEPPSNPSPKSSTSPSSDTITASAGGSQVGTPSQTPQEGNSKDAQHPDAGWTTFEVSVFDKAAEMYSGNSCCMARLVSSKSCSEVHARLLKVGLPAALAGAATLTAAPVGRGRLRKSGATKRKMRSAGQAKHVVLKRLRKAKGPEETPLYQPCQCKGACKEGCPCGDEGHFCEKFCACGPECQSRYKGCVCRGGCRTRACPCLASDRECDPDLCKPCQWSICKQRPPGSVDCQNMKLRLRQHKRVGMGLSRVAGWGAFAQEDIRKNEFVAEYTGELINHKEADRRGKAYDRDSNTYLFDLNDDWVIDAKHRGNKMRFANHSNQPNCRVQIKMVDGDHRVAIYAAQDIPTGTELLYNYGNRFGKV